MSLPWIVQGDATSHGGTVIEGDPTFTTHGKPVAHVGHMVTCPKCKGGPFPIVTGATDFINNGKPVARHGDKTACGATLISGQAVSRWSAASTASVNARKTNNFEHDQHLIFEDQEGRPLGGIPYRISDERGKVITGRSGTDGKTRIVAGHDGETLNCTIARKVAE